MRSKGFPGGVPALAMIGFGTLVGAFVPGSVSAVPAAHTYYVSPSGNDTANGLTKKTAWRTLSRASQQVFIAGELSTQGRLRSTRATVRATSRSVRMARRARSSMRAIIQVSSSRT